MLATFSLIIVLMLLFSVNFRESAKSAFLFSIRHPIPFSREILSFAIIEKLLIKYGESSFKVLLILFSSYLLFGIIINFILEILYYSSVIHATALTDLIAELLWVGFGFLLANKTYRIILKQDLWKDLNPLKTNIVELIIVVIMALVCIDLLYISLPMTTKIPAFDFSKEIFQQYILEIKQINQNNFLRLAEYFLSTIVTTILLGVSYKITRRNLPVLSAISIWIIFSAVITFFVVPVLLLVSVLGTVTTILFLEYRKSLLMPIFFNIIVEWSFISYFH
ncbi:MAG: hypothetical protein HYV28_15525 [Ignavibacteriales bacterium]|nr:hypothetical protein [Ignavibacteriales bacterium]